MTAVKITEDMLLEELFSLFPEARDILASHGYMKIVEMDVEDIVIDKLSLRGLLRLLNLGDEEAGAVIREIQSLYNKKLEER